MYLDGAAVRRHRVLIVFHGGAGTGTSPPQPPGPRHTGWSKDSAARHHKAAAVLRSGDLDGGQVTASSMLRVVPVADPT